MQPHAIMNCSLYLLLFVPSLNPLLLPQFLPLSLPISLPPSATSSHTSSHGGSSHYLSRPPPLPPPSPSCPLLPYIYQNDIAVELPAKVHFEEIASGHTSTKLQVLVWLCPENCVDGFDGHEDLHCLTCS